MTLPRRRFLGAAALAAAAAAWRLARPGGGEPAAARAAGSPGPAARGDLRLVLISDLNGPYGSTGYIPEVHRAVALIPSLRPDLVLCAGDMVAGQKRGLGRSRLAAMWDGFERDVLAPLRRAGIPFAPAMGNHDASGARRGATFLFADDRAEAAAFWGRWRDRLGLDLVEDAGFPFHYALRRDDLLVAVWDASTATVPPAQLASLERLLAGPVGRGAARRLVMGHLPLRAVGQGRDRAGDVLARPDDLQALLERGGVEAYISGHHHAWYPARLGGLDLYQLGAAGSGPRRLLGQSSAPFQTLTVLDLFSSGGRTVATTYDLRSLAPVSPERLPARLTDAAGRVLPRRQA